MYSVCRVLYSHLLFFPTAIVDDERLSAEEMDERRRQNIAYEYLCHLEEAKQWVQFEQNVLLPYTTDRFPAVVTGPEKPFRCITADMEWLLLCVDPF